MKIQYFIRIYVAYILISINVLFLIIAHDKFILIPILIFYTVLRRLNKKGFLSRCVRIYILCSVVLHVWLNQFYSVFLLIDLTCLFCMIRFHLPIRDDVKKLVRRIDMNIPLIIFYNGIEQLGNTFFNMNDFRQSEIDWLSYRILLISTKLKSIHKVYIDNENLGENFHVNIA